MFLRRWSRDAPLKLRLVTTRDYVARWKLALLYALPIANSLRLGLLWGPQRKVRSIDTTITGPSYGNDLTATGERAFRITRTFVDRTSFGSDDGFDSAVRITLPADHPGHALERGFQCKMQRHSCSIVKGLNS